jgi:hypothetical protein
MRLGMHILPAKQVAHLVGKNLNWVYANARRLGGLKIGGSWIFTQANLEHALALQTQPAAPETEKPPKKTRKRGRPPARPPAPAQSPANVEEELAALAAELGLESLLS